MQAEYLWWFSSGKRKILWLTRILCISSERCEYSLTLSRYTSFRGSLEAHSSDVSGGSSEGDDVMCPSSNEEECCYDGYSTDYRMVSDIYLCGLLMMCVENGTYSIEEALDALVVEFHC